MSSRQYLINASSKHQIFLQRLAGSTYKQMQTFIDKSLKETVNLLASSSTITSRKRFNIIIKDLTNLNAAIFSDMSRNAKKNMTALAKYEADFTKRLTEDATKTSAKKDSDVGFILSTPTVAQLHAAAFTSILDKRPGTKGLEGGITVQEALDNFGYKKTGDILTTVRVGYALGKTTSDIAKDIQGVMTSIVQRQAVSLARTITNHVASTSRNTFYQENIDIVKQYQIVATLDDRTSLECGSLDGQIFDMDDFEQPPYHWGCRTTFVAVIEDKYDLKGSIGGDRPSKGDNGSESVSTQTNYGSWIKAQSASFQDEVLGPNRGALLRAGMSVDKFVDTNYRPITIDELRTKDNEYIFNKAGL